MRRKLFWLILFIVILSMVSRFIIIKKTEEAKIVVNLLQNANLKDNDFILLTYYPKDKFEKYFNFDKYNVISINKGNFSDYLNIQTKEDFKKIDNSYFDKKFQKDILSKFRPNQKLAVIIFKGVPNYSPIKLNAILKDKNEYRKTPFLVLVFSQINNDIIRNCSENLQMQKFEENGSWAIITFSKK